MSLDERHFSLRSRRGSITMGPRYQFTNSSHPREVSPSSLCSAPHSQVPHHCFPLSLKLEAKRTGDHAAFLPSLPSALKARPTVFGSPTSLSLSLCPGIPTSGIKEAKVRFLSLSSLQTSRGGFLLAESALFTLSSLLFVADSGTRQRAIAFFSSLYAFCHLADLHFSFVFLSLSHQARVLRPQQSLS